LGNRDGDRDTSRSSPCGGPGRDGLGSSPRELEVVELLVVGRRNKAIAEELSISENTPVSLGSPSRSEPIGSFCGEDGEAVVGSVAVDLLDVELDQEVDDRFGDALPGTRTGKPGG
jgi:hypothetical protein